MVAVIPVLYWVPFSVSAVLLVTSWLAMSTVGYGSPKTVGLLSAWFLAAAYLQFFTRSMVTSTIGLVLQVGLAIYLIIRVRGQS